MDPSQDRRVALLSIHPRYADAILAGSKTVEFRKRPFARSVDLIAIYSTSPIQRVVAVARVECVDVAAPGELWARYGARGAISREDFETYFRDAHEGAAIRIDDVVPLPAVALEGLGDIRPPQSYTYLDDVARSRLDELLRSTPSYSSGGSGRTVMPVVGTQSIRRLAAAVLNRFRRDPAIVDS